MSTQKRKVNAYENAHGTITRAHERTVHVSEKEKADFTGKASSAASGLQDGMGVDLTEEVRPQAPISRTAKLKNAFTNAGIGAVATLGMITSGAGIAASGSGVPTEPIFGAIGFGGGMGGGGMGGGFGGAGRAVMMAPALMAGGSGAEQTATETQSVDLSGLSNFLTDKRTIGAAAAVAAVAVLTSRPARDFYADAAYNVSNKVRKMLGKEPKKFEPAPSPSRGVGSNQYAFKRGRATGYPQAARTHTRKTSDGRVVVVRGHSYGGSRYRRDSAL